MSERVCVNVSLVIIILFSVHIHTLKRYSEQQSECAVQPTQHNCSSTEKSKTFPFRTLNKPLCERYNNNKTKTQPDQMPKTIFVSLSTMALQWPAAPVVVSIECYVRTLSVPLHRKVKRWKRKKRLHTYKHTHARTHTDIHTISPSLSSLTHRMNPNIRRHYKFSVIITEQIILKKKKKGPSTLSAFICKSEKKKFDEIEHQIKGNQFDVFALKSIAFAHRK